MKLVVTLELTMEEYSKLEQLQSKANKKSIGEFISQMVKTHIRALDARGKSGTMEVKL